MYHASAWPHCSSITFHHFPLLFIRLPSSALTCHGVPAGTDVHEVALRSGGRYYHY